MFGTLFERGFDGRLYGQHLLSGTPERHRWLGSDRYGREPGEEIWRVHRLESRESCRRERPAMRFGTGWCDLTIA
jgi:hypothetical protein